MYQLKSPLSYLLYLPDISGMLVLGVSLRTAWKALALANDHEAQSPCPWRLPCILPSPWPWNFKARDLQKYSKCKKHYKIESGKSSEWHLRPVDSIDIVNLSWRSQLTQLWENLIDSIDQLDRFRDPTMAWFWFGSRH